MLQPCQSAPTLKNASRAAAVREGPRTRARAGGGEARGGEGQTATHTKRQHKHNNAAMSKAHSSQLAVSLGVRPKHRREPNARLPTPRPNDDSTKPTAPSASRGLQAESRKAKLALYEEQRASQHLATSSEQGPEDTKTEGTTASHSWGRGKPKNVHSERASSRPRGASHKANPTSHPWGRGHAHRRRNHANEHTTKQRRSQQKNNSLTRRRDLLYCSSRRLRHPTVGAGGLFCCVVPQGKGFSDS